MQLFALCRGQYGVDAFARAERQFEHGLLRRMHRIEGLACSRFIEQTRPKPAIHVVALLVHRSHQLPMRLFDLALNVGNLLALIGTQIQIRVSAIP